MRGVALGPSARGWDSAAVHTPQVVEHRENFYLFYTGGPLPEGEPRQIGVAVADDPAGPWTRSPLNPVVPRGDAGDWDGEVTGDSMPVVVGDGIRLYYKGRDADGQRALGMALARDGLGPYEKYDGNPLFSWRYDLESWNILRA